MLNPLTPEINLSTQRSMLRFFNRDFKFYCLLLGEKEAHLIDFSFKFNEIKFCSANELVNVAKNVSYFYNKCRPVNCMHYIKCAVNSSLLTSGCYRRSVAPYIPVLSQHSIHKGGDLQVYFGVIFHETKHHTQTHITSGAFIHHTLPLAARSTQMAAYLG